ncbi:hypothetical protein KZZ52_48500 [Dactylosporangium sp. AC04546]|uniref:hypothetical protein n=1 Tax=Dactylosporangium sp. AC04546 TaxID=2862460 RepID=UPI001EDDF50C|nr:hypothetical protein [Dactylosporangium sp. AC04546]WVK81733.1 hypothetical protein KZZ52_48500 [Dactylosporangium sp. AC04546]
MRFFLILAPIVLGVAGAVDPALGSTGEFYGIYREHPVAIEAHSVLLHWAWILFALGFVALLDPIRRRGSVLARVAWVATVLGLVTFSALMAIDLFVLALEQTFADNATVQKVNRTFETLGAWPTFGWQIPGMLGWALALILTPVAAARARVISWWTAGAALVGSALYLLFGVESMPWCLAGPAVMAGAYFVAFRSLGSVAVADEPDTFGTFRLRFGRVCMILAPLSFAIGLATVPGFAPDPAQLVRHPVQSQASAFFLHLGWLLFIPAVLTLMRGGGRFARVAGVVTVLALANFSGLMVGDYADLAARKVLTPEEATRVTDAMGTYSGFAFSWVIFGMFGSLLGLILVALATTLDGRSRWWVPALVGAGVVAFLALGVGPLSLLSPLLLLAGFGLLARGLTAAPAPAPAATPAPAPAA